MTIHLYVLCYNEMQLAPFAVQYWKRFADKVIVYDNGSTDGCIEYLSQFPFVEIRHFDSNGLDDSRYLDIKNHAWKESRGKADYVIVSDFDEFIYHKDLKQSLTEAKKRGVTILKAEWYDLVNESFPVYEETRLMHESTRGNLSTTPKTLIFDPDKIIEINYWAGAHGHNARGVIVNENGDYQVYHAINLGLDFVLDKAHKRAARLSEKNKRNKWGVHYLYSDEKLTQDYLSDLKRSIELN